MSSQWMKLVCTLLWFTFVSSISLSKELKTIDLRFKTCLKQALVKNSPPDRDSSKMICLDKFVGIPLSSCLNESKKLEYLTNSEVALKNCYYSRPQSWSASNCLDVAKKLHTVLDRDNMRLDCFSQLESQQPSRKNCLMVSKSFEQSHYKERYQQVCQEN